MAGLRVLVGWLYYGQIALSLIPSTAIVSDLHALPDCGASQIIFSIPRLRSEPTFPIVTDNDLPKEEATISPSCQLEPHEGQIAPMPIGFDP